jgi:hypothetical protein
LLLEELEVFAVEELEVFSVDELFAVERSAVRAERVGRSFSSRASRIISTWLVLFLIGVARPCAAGMKRRSAGPSFTIA